MGYLWRVRPSPESSGRDWKRDEQKGKGEGWHARSEADTTSELYGAWTAVFGGEFCVCVCEIHGETLAAEPESGSV